jgi:hypothetical protein
VLCTDHGVLNLQLGKVGICKGLSTWDQGPCFFAIHFVLLVLTFEIGLHLLVSVDKICQLIHVTLSILSPKPLSMRTFQTC